MNVLAIGVGIGFLILMVIRFWMGKEEWEDLGWSVGLLIMDVWILGFMVGCLMWKVAER